jgi:hypothetical protein
MSLNNSNFTSNKEKVEMISYYLSISIAFTGFITNSICIIIFSMIIKRINKSNIRNSGHMFKFLLVKTISDLFLMIFDASPIVYKLTYNTNRPLYIAQLWEIYFYYYLYYVCLVVSTYSEMFASIDCLFMITRRFEKFRKKFVFYLIMICVVIFSFLLFLSEIFRYEIVFDSETGHYSVELSPFNETKYVFYYTLVRIVLGDLTPFIVLILVNTLILVSIRRTTNRRRIISSKVSSLLISNAEEAEWNKVKMIFFTSLTYLLHIPANIYDLNIFDIQSHGIVYYYFTLSLFDLSFTITILPYIMFNKKFRYYFVKIICFLRWF